MTHVLWLDCMAMIIAFKNGMWGSPYVLFILCMWCFFTVWDEHNTYKCALSYASFLLMYGDVVDVLRLSLSPLFYEIITVLTLSAIAIAHSISILVIHMSLLTHSIHLYRYSLFRVTTLPLPCVLHACTACLLF